MPDTHSPSRRERIANRVSQSTMCVGSSSFTLTPYRVHSSSAYDRPFINTDDHAYYSSGSARTRPIPRGLESSHDTLLWGREYGAGEAEASLGGRAGCQG